MHCQAMSGGRSSCDLAPLADVAHQRVAVNMPFRGGTWRAPKSKAERSRKMRIVVEPGGIGDLGEHLARFGQFSSIQKTRRVIQANRLNEPAARCSALREQLLEIAQ